MQGVGGRIEMDTKQMIIVIAVLIVSSIFIYLCSRKKRKNDERDWLDWENINRYCSENDNYCIIHVTAIRQHAKTGTKGYAKWINSEEVSAFWIPDAWPKTGNIFVCNGSFGHGPHHEENVFYVNDIKYRLPSSLIKGKDRYIRRQKKVNHCSHDVISPNECGE